MTAIPYHDLPQQLSVDGIVGFDQIGENNIRIGSVLGKSVKGLLDIVHVQSTGIGTCTVDAALSKHSSTLLDLVEPT